MPESSVDSYINSNPDVAMSKDEYWQANYAGKMDGIVKNPDHYNDWNYKIGKFLGSRDISKFEDEYENYLRNLANQNEYKSAQSARAWEKMMDDTKYQRMFKDFEAAGLNPYLLVNNGSFSASAPSAAKADYKYSQQSHKETDKGRNFALLFLALARVAAALL